MTIMIEFNAVSPAAGAVSAGAVSGGTVSGGVAFGEAVFESGGVWVRRYSRKAAFCWSTFRWCGHGSFFK
ncbi:MAG: hypothetical protein ACE5GY_10365, partial [Thermodesulfobacteriota bacterium]